MAAGWVALAVRSRDSVCSISARSRAVGPLSCWACRQPTLPRQPPGPSRRGSHGTGADRRAQGRRHGHFHARAEINGRPIDVMVDTGASIVALTYEDARRAGVYVRDSDFTHRVSTANGLARVAPVTIDRVSIGDITVRNVPGAVTEPGKLGDLPARHVVPEPAAARRHAQRHAGAAGVGVARRGAGQRPFCHISAVRAVLRVVHVRTSQSAGFAGGRQRMLPKPRADLSPTRPTSSACRSSSRPAFANTMRAGCSPRRST